MEGGGTEGETVAVLAPPYRSCSTNEGKEKKVEKYQEKAKKNRGSRQRSPCRVVDSVDNLVEVGAGSRIRDVDEKAEGKKGGGSGGLFEV